MELTQDVVYGGLQIQNDMIIAQLKRVFEQEIVTLKKSADFFTPAAAQLVALLSTCRGKIFFSGAGKSGIIAQKIAATFSSFSIPALFIHPYDASHGDVGSISSSDMLVVLSKTATGSESELLIKTVRNCGAKTALIAFQKGSLTDLVDLAVELVFDQEACLYNLAPTSSSTLMLVFGDALAISLAQLKGFAPHDFVRVHPAGSLGRRLTMLVDELMHTGASLPIVKPDLALVDVILAMTSKKLGHALVVDDVGFLVGVVSDGDLRRALTRGGDISQLRARDLASSNPKFIARGALAQDAINLMEQYKITALPVLDGRSVVGLIHIHDLVKAGFAAL